MTAAAHPERPPRGPTEPGGALEGPARTPSGGPFAVPERRRAAAKRTNAVLVYLLLLVSLQVFLLVVAVEGVLGHEPALARNAAILSLVVLAMAALTRWFLRDD